VSMGALEGVRVLDLSQGAAGPICTQVLGDLGADVVKVEPPGGEWGRTLGPPFVAGVAAAFLGMNRNKRSIVVDLKRPGAAEVIHRLAVGADVFVESFRPGVTARLGVDYDMLAADNPGLVYCAITAFGSRGPWRDKPGVDGIMQAMSGLMSVTGTEDGPPVKVGVPAADMVGGHMAVEAILGALLARQRSGRGQRVEVALLDALLAFQAVPLSMFLASGEVPLRLGSAAPYAAPNEAFPTRDGYIMVAAYTPERWGRLCAVLGRPDLERDPRFASGAERVRHRAALAQELAAVFQERTTAEWLERLEAADILCGPLLAYPDLVTHPQVQANEMIVSFDHTQMGGGRVPGIPHKLQHTPGTLRLPPPLPGEHTETVLREAGFSPEEIDRLAAAGVIGTEVPLVRT